MSEYEFLVRLIKAVDDIKNKFGKTGASGKCYEVFGKLTPEEEKVFNEKLSQMRVTPYEEKETPEKIDIKITFIGGGEIVIPDGQWDDYHYDGKFFTIIKDGADIAMYNAKEVFSLVLVQEASNFVPKEQ